MLAARATFAFSCAGWQVRHYGRAIPDAGGMVALAGQRVKKTQLLGSLWVAKRLEAGCYSYASKGASLLNVKVSLTASSLAKILSLNKTATKASA
jgi:hypothetical protein